MLDIPFQLEALPAKHADAALKRLTREKRDSIPILLGDADIFSAEWAESVDAFQPPSEVLQAAIMVDVDAWFAEHGISTSLPIPAPQDQKVVPVLERFCLLPFDAMMFPFRLMYWAAARRRPHFFTPGLVQYAPAEDPISLLRAQLAELEGRGVETKENIARFRATISALAIADETAIFPDPVAYVTPRRGTHVAAGLVQAAEPWQAAAWLQHGAYAQAARHPVLVAHCKWLWLRHGARIITASTDHMGFEMDRPIASPWAARDVLARFAALGATEVNAEQSDGDGKSLIGAKRLWVWWD